ncbi:MAG: YchJ family metal-binding protein [Chloroflexota bacterium]
MRYNPNDPCPCTSGKKYKKCCRRYHQGMKVPTPEALVRARFGAYAIGLTDYLIDTLHPDHEDQKLSETKIRAQVDAYSIRNTFLKCDIVSAEDDKVTYRAFIMAFHQDPLVYTEDAVFAQHDNKWYYLSGETHVLDEDEIEAFVAEAEQSADDTNES